MANNNSWLTVGKLVSPQGLKGELRVKPLSEFPERFTKPGKRWLQDKQEVPKEVKLLNGRLLPGKEIYIVRFAGIDNRSEAELIIGQNLVVPSSNRPQLKKGEFHFLDLVGLEARLDHNGPGIGQVVNLTNAGNDLLEVKLIEGRKILIPFVKAIVPEINVKEGWLLVTPPPGLLEL